MVLNNDSRWGFPKADDALSCRFLKGRREGKRRKARQGKARQGRARQGRAGQGKPCIWPGWKVMVILSRHTPFKGLKSP